jgi:hypothetical protein
LSFNHSSLVLFTYFSGIVTITAEYRSAGSGLERYLGTFTALSASCGEQLMLRAKTGLYASIVTAAYLTLFSGLTAGRTAFRGIGIAFSLKGFLLFDTKSKSGTAIVTGDGLFLHSH